MILSKLILCTVMLLSPMTVVSQTPEVHYKSSSHYKHRVTLFHYLPMITSDNIVMLGNSLTEFGGDWNKRIPDASGLIINRGIMGDDAIGMLHRLNQITPFAPKKIFVGCGINDVSHHLSNDEVVLRVEKLLSTVRQESSKSMVYYFSIFPINESFGRWKTLHGRTNDIPLINDKLRSWCKSNGVTYIDVFSALKSPNSNVLPKEYTVDGLHLTEKGYSIWAETIKSYF